MHEGHLQSFECEGKNFYTKINLKQEGDNAIQVFMNAFWDEVYSDYINGFSVDEDDRKECPHTFMLFGKQSDTWFESEAEMNQEAFEILANVFHTKGIDRQYALTHFDEMIVYIKEWATNQNIISFMKQYFDSKNDSITWQNYDVTADYPYSYMINGEGCDVNYETEEECFLNAFSDLTSAYKEIFDIPEITFGYTQYDIECLLKRILRSPL